MIEVTVYDVIVRIPKGEEVKWLGEDKDWHKFIAGGAWVILLKEQTGNRILPIWVGIAEGNSIAMQLAEVSTPRPMTFDLIARLVEVAGNTVEKVAVARLHENTYYATLWLKVNGRIHEVDARPSDALNLALHVKAPIFVTPELLEQAGPFLLTTGEVATGLEALQRKAIEEQHLPPEEGELEFRSFRLLPRGDLDGRLKPAEK
jgi:bifunctional DNase/RNase